MKGYKPWVLEGDKEVQVVFSSDDRMRELIGYV